MLYEKNRDLTFWLLQYETKKGSNTLRLAVKKGKPLKNDSWDLWDFTPKAINPRWKNQWLDYNHASVSDNFLYIGTNVYDLDDNFTRCLIIRISLDDLVSKQEIKFDFFESKDFSLRCVQGAKKIMYFAAHTGNNNIIRVYSWPENTMNVSRREIRITPWSGGESYFSKCPDGTNWLARADYRVTGAWISKGVLGFMWTANQDEATRPFPYVRVVRLDEKTLKVVDEPDIWHQKQAYAWADASVNVKGEVGITLFTGGGSQFPSHVVGFFDSLLKTWALTVVLAGKHGPADDKWGDYLTVRPYSKENISWLACGFTLQTGKKESDVEVHAVKFRIG